MTEGELMQDDRKAALIDLWVGDARIGHVCVHSAAAMPAWTSPSTTSDGLIVPHLGIAKGEIVHAALQYMSATFSGICCGEVCEMLVSKHRAKGQCDTTHPR